MSEATPPPLAPADSYRFTCPNCGAQTAYAPGTTMLRCSACGTETAIAPDDRSIDEHPYDAWAALPPKPVATIAEQVLQCQGCGATTETDLLSDTCQFCGGVLVAVSHPEGLIVPEAVVPFRIDRRGANDAFGTWVRTRRFAPNALKKVGTTEAIKGTYLPHWTYDAQTQTDYDGQRGDHYYTTETRAVSDGQGGTRTETYQVQHTRWSHASGRIARDFDDVVVHASNRLPAERLADAGPWELQTAVPFRPEYLAGYAALRYEVDPDVGLQDARGQMENVIEGDCRADIGGDEQRVQHMDVRYAAVMFKLILLPLWIASYLYAGTTYQVVVNANTGEVVGDRPISKVKVALAVIAGLILLGVLVTIFLINRGNTSASTTR